MMEEDKDILLACWTALGAVINSIPKELQPSYVRTMREAVQVHFILLHTAALCASMPAQETVSIRHLQQHPQSCNPMACRRQGTRSGGSESRARYFLQASVCPKHCSQCCLYTCRACCRYGDLSSCPVSPRYALAIFLIWQAQLLAPSWPSLCAGLQGSSGELRETAAEGLGELVEVTSQESLRPFTVQITGEGQTDALLRALTPASAVWQQTDKMKHSRLSLPDGQSPTACVGFRAPHPHQWRPL